MSDILLPLLHPEKMLYPTTYYGILGKLNGLLCDEGARSMNLHYS